MAQPFMLNTDFRIMLIVAIIWLLAKTLWCGKAWRKERSSLGKVCSICIETIYCFLVYYYPFLLLALAWWLGWL